MNNQAPLYVAKKSIIPAFKFWRVILFFLVIPIIIIVCDIIKRKCESVEFYEDYVITKKGVFNKSENKSVFPKILSVSSTISIFGYGSLAIDTVGKWDVSLDEISEPKKLKAFLEARIADSSTVKNISNNPFVANM